jgi:hypothetical protein
MPPHLDVCVVRDLHEISDAVVAMFSKLEACEPHAIANGLKHDAECHIDGGV